MHSFLEVTAKHNDFKAGADPSSGFFPACSAIHPLRRQEGTLDARARRFLTCASTPRFVIRSFLNDSFVLRAERGCLTLAEQRPLADIWLLLARCCR
jgi:hypothetical protein